uniref:Uncharacterized protein n=1 Tax=Malurus cyaneus samueli TaxID=2593467 RepID=A0A8C5X4N5_9PASS
MIPGDSTAGAVGNGEFLPFPALTDAHVPALPPGQRVLPAAGAGVHGHGLADDQPILDQLPDLLPCERVPNSSCGTARTAPTPIPQGSSDKNVTLPSNTGTPESSRDSAPPLGDPHPPLRVSPHHPQDPLTTLRGRHEMSCGCSWDSVKGCPCPTVQ